MKSRSTIGVIMLALTLAATSSAQVVPPRHYYHTTNGVLGDGALTACTAGYHMANIYEILNPTTLGIRYGFGPEESPLWPGTANRAVILGMDPYGGSQSRLHRIREPMSICLIAESG